jgi:signal transduction histidine kinase
MSFCAFNSRVWAADAGASKDAMAMVKKAVAYLKLNGKDKTLSEASNPKGLFVNGDIYLTITDSTGRVLAHGLNPRLIGKDAIELKDVDGKYFVKEMLVIAKKEGSGWVDYKWPNPITREIQLKSVYFEQIDHLVIQSGYYK